MSSSARTRLSLGNLAADGAKPGPGRNAALEVTAASAFPGVHASYVVRNIAITVWFGAATLDSLAVFERSCKTFCAEYPQGVSSIHLMVPGRGAMPSAEARREFSRIVRENAEHAVAAGVLIPSTGFWASALRSMVTALLLLAPRSLSLQIFGELAPLAHWLAPLHAQRTGVVISADELLRLLEAVERASASTAA